MQHFNPEINAPQLLTSNKKTLHQLVLHFLMCISCSNEDMAEFKDEPKHHLRSTTSLLQIAQFLNHQAVPGKYTDTARVPSKKHSVKIKAFTVLPLRSHILMVFNSLLQTNIFPSQQIFLRCHPFMKDTYALSQLGT